jgi:eukaryotic-like serine/threonine-protein kinase
LPNDNQRYVVISLNLARLRIANGDGVSSEGAIRHALAVRRRLFPPGDWRIAEAQSLLGAALIAQKRYADAEPLLLAAYEGLKPVRGFEDWERVANQARLVELYEALGRPQQASAYRPSH